MRDVTCLRQIMQRAGLTLHIRLPNAGLKIVVNVCFQCVPTFLNICVVVFFFFLVFAIMGVQVHD